MGAHTAQQDPLPQAKELPLMQHVPSTMLRANQRRHLIHRTTCHMLQQEHMLLIMERHTRRALMAQQAHIVDLAHMEDQIAQAVGATEAVAEVAGHADISADHPLCHAYQLMNQRHASA